MTWLSAFRGTYPSARFRLVVAFGFLLLVPYGYAWALKDLRRETVGFEIAFFAAFVLYGVAVVVIL